MYVPNVLLSRVISSLVVTLACRWAETLPLISKRLINQLSGKKHQLLWDESFLPGYLWCKTAKISECSLVLCVRWGQGKGNLSLLHVVWGLSWGDSNRLEGVEDVIFWRLLHSYVWCLIVVNWRLGQLRLSVEASTYDLELLLIA